MKRVAAPLVLLLVLTTACGSAKAGSSGGASTSAAPSASSTTTRPTTLAVALPKSIASVGVLKVGVKCDYPPFGFTGSTGQPDGYAVTLAQQLATYAFGSAKKLKVQCVTSSNRIPYLTTKRVDLLIATLGRNKERARVIGYTKPYFSSTGRLLVLNNSNISGPAGLAGKTVLLVKGTPYTAYFQQCVPTAKRVQYDTSSEALTALEQGRGQAYVDDDTLLVSLASKSPKHLKVVGKVYSSDWGMGVRLTDTAFESWLNVAIGEMQKSDLFWKDLQKWLPARSAHLFATSMPRPGHSLSYPQGPLFTCP